MSTTTTQSADALAAADLCSAFADTVAQFGDAPALRSSDGATELTWNEFDACMREVAGGLAALGVGKDGTVALLLTNRYESSVCDMATLHVGAVPCSLYNSSAPDQLAYLLGDVRADVLVTERALADKAREALGAMDAPPKLVLVDGEEGDGADVSSFAALRSMGTPLPAQTKPELTKDDIITVVYTSGTTGVPKGVELTHDSIMAQIRGLDELGRLPIAGRAISYLPMAHLGDRVVSYYMPIVSAACITYHPDPRTFLQVLPEVNPTLFMAVPRIWGKAEGVIRRAIAARPDDVRARIEEALALGEEIHVAGRTGEPDPEAVERFAAYDDVLAPLRAEFGLDAGELIFTGAAPLPADTLMFYAAIGADLVECFGQSETAGIILCNPAGRSRPNTVGIEMPGVSCKLADDGELLVKGPQVMAGYRGKPDLTKEAIDEDGWLRTGDIAAIDEKGYYRIVDRKKEIFVSEQGKNVSPAYVENAIAQAGSTAGVVCAIGDGRPYVTALIVPEPENAMTVAGTQDPAAFAAAPEIVEAIVAQVRSANGRMNRAEQVRRIRIVGEIWMPGTDQLTPTMKLRRKNIDKSHAELIASLYGPPSEEVIELD